jgi:hypothetical protein
MNLTTNVFLYVSDGFMDVVLRSKIVVSGLAIGVYGRTFFNLSQDFRL